MKTRHPIRNVILSALAGAACLTSASASTVLVDWGGTYLSSGTSSAYTSRGATTINDPTLKGVLYGYNDTQHLSPTSGAYSGTSSTFYGAVQLTTPATGSGSQIRVRAAEAGWDNKDRIYIQTPTATTANGNIPANAQGLIFWKKEDFLSHAADTVSLSQIDQLSLNTPYARVSNSAVRFAVQSGGVWYLSQHALTSGQKLAVELGTLTLDNPSDSLWATWSIQSSPTSLMDAAPTTFDVEGSTLTDITAVGFYFTANYSLSNAVMFGFDAFSVTASIPEPSSAAILGGTSLLLAGALGVKRARKK